MLKHATIIGAAVLSAVAAAQGLMAFVSPPPAVAAAPPERMLTAASAQVDAPAPDTLAGGPARSAAQVTKARDGHFWAEAEVDGRWVRFLVDTGASSVALTGADAQRLGVDLASLSYDRPVTTASGQTHAAMVKLDHVTVAGARVDDVDAIVVRTGLSTSLLGMSYLGRLSRFEATRSALILRP